MPRGGSRNDVPRRIGGERIRELPLAPAEGRVLAQIDGLTSVAELELVTGLTADELDRALERLAELRLIQTGAVPAAERSAARPAMRPALSPPPQRPSPRPPEPEPKPEPQAASAPIAPVVADEPSPVADGSLSPEERRRIQAFLVRAESVDFYKLLGVGRKAERAEIRSAYFGLAKEFHPDAYYGRDIGVARHRLERIFRQITRAYEVLSRTKSRKEYDEYIKGQAVLQGREEEEQAWQAEEQRRQTLVGAKAVRAPEAVRAEGAKGVAPAAAAVRAEGAKGAAPAPVTPLVEAAGPSAAGAAPPPRPAAPGRLEPAPRPVPAPRPDAAAPVRLSSSAEQGIESRPAAGSPAPVEPPRAAHSWQRLRVARQLTAVLGKTGAPQPAKDERRGGDYLAEAEAAEKDEEWGRVFGLTEAAEKLGLTEAERSRMVALRDRAGRELARIAFSQARFSESTGDLGAALQHAENACRYGPEDPDAWDTTARLWLRLGRELHRARDAAAKAIQLAPQSIAYRLTMIRVYLAAGLPKNARREAEAALALKPDDKQAKALLAEARAQHE